MVGIGEAFEPSRVFHSNAPLQGITGLPKGSIDMIGNLLENLHNSQIITLNSHTYACTPLFCSLTVIGAA